ncbi:MAG: hypothetical protein EBZ69_00095 [Alphaproteobacteria bacterium]|nr:hypothetical protein [Alphaproteobacteria bacterium]
MQLKLSRIDLARTKKSWPTGAAFEPAYVYKRPTETVERWLVVSAPLVPGLPQELSESYQDPYIRIPLFSYALSPDADLAFAYILQLGLSCAGHTPKTVNKLHIVTGFPVDLLYEDGITKPVGIQYWFGLAYLQGE